MTEASQIQPESIVSRATDTLFGEVDDELLAIDEQAGVFYAMNETAGKVWALIEEPTPVSAVCAQLAQEFAVDEATCQREVLQLLQGLVDAGLVQVEG